MVWLMSHLFFKGVSDDIYLTVAHACWPPPPPLARPSLAQSGLAQLGSVRLHVRSLFLLNQRDVFSAIIESQIQCHSFIHGCYDSVLWLGHPRMSWGSCLRVLIGEDFTVSRKKVLFLFYWLSTSYYQSLLYLEKKACISFWGMLVWPRSSRSLTVQTLPSSGWNPEGLTT